MNNMKKLTFLLLLSVFGNQILAQKNLYFVSGDTYENDEFPKFAYINTILWKFNKGKIIVQDTIGRENEWLYGLKHYHDQHRLIGIKKVFTLKIHYSDVIEKHQLFQIDTQANSIKIDTFTLYRSAELIEWLAESTKKKNPFEIISDDISWILPILYDHNDTLKYIVEYSRRENRDIDAPTELYYRAVDLKKWQFTQATVQDYVYGEDVGLDGVGLELYGFNNFILKSKDGTMELPITIDFSKRPILPLKLKYMNNVNVGDTRSIWVNTSKIFVHLNGKTTDKNIIGKTFTGNIITILNKSKKEWKQFNIESNLPRIRSYGNWIVGEQAQYYTKNRDRSWESPGKNIRRQDRGFCVNDTYPREKPYDYIDNKGTPFDLRMNTEQTYFPGKLFAINADTWDYYEWETNQGDSEILLVENNKIFYRVYDKIYERIVDGKKLYEPKLILEDKELVPQIHWMFLEN